MHVYIHHNTCILYTYTDTNIYTYIIMYIYVSTYMHDITWTPPKTRKKSSKSHLESRLFHPTWALNLQSFHPSGRKKSTKVPWDAVWVPGTCSCPSRWGARFAKRASLGPAPMQWKKTWKANMDEEIYGCFFKWWYPQNTSKWSFLVGKPMVVGYHHFRKPPYWFP